MPADELLALRGALLAIGVDASVAPVLFGEIEWRDLAPGEVLSRQGEEDQALYVLADGRLDVLRSPEVEGHQAARPTRVATLAAPQLLGELQLFSGGVRTATLTAAGPCRVGRLGLAAFERLSERVPDVGQRIARLAIERIHRDQLREILPTFLDTTDDEVLEQVMSSIDWILLRRGDVLVREGEQGTDLFFLVSGRMRAVVGGMSGRVLGDLLPGETVGETRLFSDAPRNATVFATRDSTLARLSREHLAATLERYPRLAMRLASIAVQRAVRMTAPQSVPRASVNVAVIAGEPGAPIPDVAVSLVRALAAHGPVAVIDRRSVGRAMRQEYCDVGQDDPRDARLRAWLSDQEAQHRFLLFIPDREPSGWTERCLRYSDLVLTVASADGAPGAPPPASEELLARRWLVLLHGDQLRAGAAGAWRARLPFERHLHLRRGNAGDLARLARAVAGREIGLVLGGGGARGYAHLGMLRAIDELGIPIDVLGGTSVGACVCGFYAAGVRGVELEATFRRVLGAPSDYTLPVVSVLKGRHMYQRMREVFGDLTLDDLPLPIFCVASDISLSRMLVLERGGAADAVMASCSLPAIFPPVNVDGRWAVDGALVNGVPLDVMRARVGLNGMVIASVVSAGGGAPDVDATPGAQTGSGWLHLFRKLRRSLDLPVIADVITRAAAAAGDHQLQAAIEQGRPDLCVRHETSGYSAIDFQTATPLVARGYTTAIAALGALRQQGVLPP